MQTFTGKQLILNEVNASCSRSVGVGITTLLSRFAHMHFLDGQNHVKELANDGKIIVQNGLVFKR